MDLEIALTEGIFINLTLAEIVMDDRYMSIFVGREKDLELLSTRFESRMRDIGPPKVYSYLNAPGIGKTTLIRRFGDKVEREHKGIHLYFTANSSHHNEFQINQDLVDAIDILIRNQDSLIQEFVDRDSSGYALRRDLRRVQDEINRIIENKEFRFSTTASLLNILLKVVPVVFTTDEIQIYQNIGDKGGEKMLRSYSQFLADLLSKRILLVISGTQYSILSQIGYGIGSPLNGKIQLVVISPLKSEDIEDYIMRFRNLYPNYDNVEELETYLHAFSGGHPRTIEKIVEGFFSLEETPNFTEELTKRVETLMSKSLLDREKLENLKRLQSHEEFNEVKRWLLQGMANNLQLNQELNEEKNELIFQLMTMGFIVMNGNSNYYITSYFHGLFFLKSITGSYEQFLHEILSNRYFREMVGGLSGLGFTFEKIIFASLILRGNRPLETGSERFDVQDLNKIKVLRSNDASIIATLKLDSDTLYHTPSMEGIDGVFEKGGERILVQVTTQRFSLKSKYGKFKEKVHALRTEGWFISLYKVSGTDGSILVTSGDELNDLLGESVYSRMIEVKEFLSDRQ